LGPLLSIVLIQCYSFGCHLFLGWDSSTYAWWATLFQEKGALTMILQWHYPQLYVLLLSGFGSTIGSVNTAEHILPLLASLPLGYAYYSLTMRLTSAFQGLALVSRPVLLASPLMIGYFLRYGVETAKLLPLGPSATFDWTWLYLSGFAIPIGGVGIMSLTRLSRRHHPIARYI